MCAFKNRLLQCSSVILAGAAVTSFSVAQDDEIPYGLLAKYTVGENSVERIDTELGFDWGGASPDERLPAGPFSAEWSGNLLARSAGRHTFHAFLAGEVYVLIDGKEVLNASQQWGFASGMPVQLTSGDHTIHVRYRTPAESDKPRARLVLFWLADQFTLEPIPADILTRDESTAADVAARGHRLADGLRCAACHQTNTGLPSMKAPSLDRVKGSQSRDVLMKRIQNPHSVVANSHMPNFGFNEEEAGSIADFLLSVSKEGHEVSGGSLKEKDVANGKRLLHSLGCAACHRLPEGFRKRSPLAAPFEGPDLTNVSQRRSASWLDRWLKSPASLNTDHRMPVFDLSKDERRQLTAALSAGGENVNEIPVGEFSRESIDAGRKLVIAAGCAACHEIPSVKSLAVPPLKSDSFAGGRMTCLKQSAAGSRPQDKVRRLPFYQLPEDDSEALKQWVATVENSGAIGTADRGRQLLQRNGCIACHDRNNNRGLSSIAASLQKRHPDLSGQSQGLVPPSLTAVGDKLSDDYLAKAVAGEQKERRLPWLFVRMPKFRHSDAERAAIVHYLTTTDRIPDEADAARQDVLAHVDLSGKSQASTADLLLGNQLTGAGGFNCVACHKAGPFEPRNVALGTRGSDIMTMGSRIRPRFFQRWMKNPIRVVRGIEMPAIKKGMPHVLDGSLPAQIGAVWKALSDKRFTPPTVTSRFEQVVNANAGGPPRIIRDVFTIGLGKDREAVARAMAIGFGNGHNILIDLDNMQVRLWTMGEFARQRTEGKSWYWDMPGLLVRGDTVRSPFSMENKRGPSVAVSDESRFAEVLSYRLLQNGVEVDCVWRFIDGTFIDRQKDTQPHFTATRWQRLGKQLDRVVTRHRFESIDDIDGKQGHGWRHSVTLVDAPPESKLVGWLGVTRDAPSKYPSPVVATTSAGNWSRVAVGETKHVTLSVSKSIGPATAIAKKVVTADATTVTSTPGFTGKRLPIDTSVMPTAMTWLSDGRMAFTSLKGHVWIAEDTDADGLPDSTSLFEEGLAAPFGILADKDSLVVSHKPEILRLRDKDGDGQADEREVVSAGWGFNDNYHDWTSGLIRDDEGNMYVGLGSDYSQKTRPVNQDRWRGGVIKIDPSGIVTPLGMSMRYPMGLAIDKHGNLFATDNQGVQNTFNEINHIVAGKHYGVPSAHQPNEGIKHETPALMVPHPWTRSVNSILFLPEDFAVKALRGHGIGCEYDSRFLIRFTVQNVNGTLQGASYRFSLPNQEAGGSNFIGPICSAVAPDGSIYIGSIWDSGWQGGQNTGGITRLVPSKKGLPNGIRELRAIKGGFEVEFFGPVNESLTSVVENWSIQAYTRKWGGSYATSDSGRHTVIPRRVETLDAGKRVRLEVPELKAGYLYSLATAGSLAKDEQLWPSEAHYSMKVVPK